MQPLFIYNHAMKKSLLVPFLIIGVLFSIASCNKLDDEQENLLIGFWYTTAHNQVTSLRIDDNGTGETTTHTYTGTEWQRNTQSLQYTLSDKYLTIKHGNKEPASYKIAITGASLSLSKVDEILMFTAYNGEEEKIRALQEEIEKNYSARDDKEEGEGDDYDNKQETENGESCDKEEVTEKDEGEETGKDESSEEEDGITIIPPSVTVPENFWQNEESAAALLAIAYREIISFIATQINLEHIRITGYTTTGIPKTITAGSPEVYECWANAYSAINRCNLLIESIPEDYEIYKNEARALRCFIYYNIAHLWGKAPYVTTKDAADSDSRPASDKEEIYDRILKEIDEIGKLKAADNDRYFIDHETLQTIKGEINLERGNNSTALSLFERNTPAFALSLSNQNENYKVIFGEEIPLYTPQLTTLLTTEACGGIDEALQLWQEQGVLSYGYWAMLKRTGKAQELVNCKEHELLMPIPMRELIFNKNITQNPGY